MLTTFFGAHSFGGDAGYVDRLSRALLGRGHSVDVVYSLTAFETLRGDHPLRPYEPPAGLRLHPLRAAGGLAGLLWTHQTGGSTPYRRQLQKLFQQECYDVVHGHNLSLLGLDLLRFPTSASNRPVRLLSAHDHWLTCPLSLLWKHGRELCEQPACTSCTLRAGRPPQLWRSVHSVSSSLQAADALLVPSRHALGAHRQRGITRDIQELPYFLPEDLIAAASRAEPWRPPGGRPYFAAVGRLIFEKGFDEVIPLMRHVPEADLWNAGAGPHEPVLRRMAEGLGNIRFAGLLSETQLWSLFKGACATVVPSRFYETFGYVVLESLACATPAIVRNCGALPELIEQSEAGSVFQTAQELAALLRRYLDPTFRCQKSERATVAVRRLWNEETHLNRYFEIIRNARSGR